MNPAGSPEACPAPTVMQAYDAATFDVGVALPATGCPARENRVFPLRVSIERYTDAGSEGAAQIVFCGPFPAGVQDTSYSCNTGLALDHPKAESSHYEVALKYPGEGGSEVTARLAYSCVAGGDGSAACDYADPLEPEGR